MRWKMENLCVVTLIGALQAEGGPRLADPADGRGIELDGRALFTTNKPWVASADWQSLYRFPNSLPGRTEELQSGRRTVRVHEGPHGKIVETVNTGPETVTIRYDYSFLELPGATHLQWFFPFSPKMFDGAVISGEGARPVTVRPIEGAHISGVRSLEFVLPAFDLGFTVSAADGLWSFNDVREASWGQCYRLEYNRAFELKGKRSGWVEVVIRARNSGDVFLPLTAGQEAEAKGIPFQLGSSVGKISRSLGGLLFWQTATGGTAAGSKVGEAIIGYADGGEERLAFRWEQQVSAPDDDPRDLIGGALALQPNGKPAWLVGWRNPRPSVPLVSLAAEASSAGWRLLGVTGIDHGVSKNRLDAILRQTRGGGTVTEEIAISLDGTWSFEPENRPERAIPVPARWETLPGLRGVHRGTYRRTVDIPDVFQGRRVLLRFDAVGEYCEVRINDRSAGAALCGPLPMEFDVTGLVDVPSVGNRLEVIVKDDTHFSVPRPSADWRNRRHWIPHGIGGDNRKGLFQSVSLRGRPPVHISDVRIQTSVRKQEITVVYEFFNSSRETVTGQLETSVRLDGTSAVSLLLPATTVTLPGQVTTVITVSKKWPDPVLWQPDHPQLYSLRTILKDRQGKRLHRVETRFGFREVWFEGIHFYLNGIRCNLRGESPSYAQGKGPFETRVSTVEAVEKYLSANFNVLRFHAVPAPPFVYDVCDELGMLVIDESAIYASWGMIMPEHPRWLPECRSHLERWVRRDRNHPSIILWSAENEGLNVSQLSPAQLAEFKTVIDAHDGTRPVIFDGDGTGEGASPASVKHYVRTIADLRDRGGKASGYGRDLRNDIYWAAAYKQDVPLGCGEFLFPANDAMRAKRREVCWMMGLQTRGYRYADWFDIRPYNPHYTGFLEPGGLKKGYEEVWDVIVKSFAPIAVFDKDYDALGPFPEPPVLPAGAVAKRTLIVYNDAFTDKRVTVAWEWKVGSSVLLADKKELDIPLGYRRKIELEFTPPGAGEAVLTFTASKAGRECFRDSHLFRVVE